MAILILALILVVLGVCLEHTFKLVTTLNSDVAKIQMAANNEIAALKARLTAAEQKLGL